MPIRKEEIWQSVRPYVNTAIQHFVQPSGRWTHSANQAIGTAAWTLVNFDTTTWDPYTIKSSATNYVVTTPGVYVVGASLRWAAHATGYRGIAIYCNGAILAENTQLSIGAGADTEMTVTALWRNDASSTFQVYGYQNSGGNLNIVSATAGPITYNPVLWVTRVSL